jgi:hypothetical protein
MRSKFNGIKYMLLIRGIYDSVKNANNSGQTVYGKWSRYVLSDRVEKSQQAQFNAILNHTITENISLGGGTYLSV